MRTRKGLKTKTYLGDDLAPTNPYLEACFLNHSNPCSNPGNDSVELILTLNNKIRT